MNLKYRDLNDKEKLIYIKRFAVIIGIYCLLLVGSMGSLFTGLDIISSWNDSMNPKYESETIPDKVIEKNTQYNTDQLNESRSIIVNAVVLFFMFPLFFAIFGISNFTINIGVWVSEKLNLYTSIDLEIQQEKLDKIKKSLNNSKN